MAKRYDAAIKHLVEAHPADWLAFARLPPATKLEVVDADLSAISPAADKVIRVDAPEPYVAHLEFQSGADSEFDRRMLMYNALLRWRHRLSVRSVAILLRPEAEGQGTTGGITDTAGPDELLDFRYRMIRLWEQPVEALLSGGIGTLPLAPISHVSQDALPQVIQGIQERLAHEAAPAEAADAWAATFILLGLRYSEEVGKKLLRGVRQMEESTTYQAIIREGMEKGKAEGLAKGMAQGRTSGIAEGKIAEARALLLRLGRKRFGPPSEAVLEKLNAWIDLSRFEATAERVYEVSGWDELFADAE